MPASKPYSRKLRVWEGGGGEGWWWLDSKGALVAGKWERGPEGAGLGIL